MKCHFLFFIIAKSHLNDLAIMELVEVNSKRTQKQFLEVPLSIYRNDANWVRPLDDDINAVFDPKRNKLFNHGEAIRWILKGNDGKLIGRVAAFINQHTAKTSEYAAGGIGFFE